MLCGVQGAQSQTSLGPVILSGLTQVFYHLLGSPVGGHLSVPVSLVSLPVCEESQIGWGGRKQMARHVNNLRVFALSENFEVRKKLFFYFLKSR